MTALKRLQQHRNVPCRNGAVYTCPHSIGMELRYELGRHQPQQTVGKA
jgi:hypothetical protein